MKRKISAFARSYRAALTLHVRGADGRAPARALGLRALNLGLATLDLAKIHENALITLVVPDGSPRATDRIVQRGVAFFALAIRPIERAHRSERAANAGMRRAIDALTVRTKELAASNRKLQQEVVQRRAVEASLRSSESSTAQLLEKSSRMQQELRHLSRRLLTAQEEERKRISRELHDVVAQALTGINVRLDGLKTQSAASTSDLHRKIAAAQRMLQQSVAIVHRFARDLRPSSLDDLGLIPALHSHLKDFTSLTGIRASLTAAAAVERLDAGRRTALYRVAQEALTNAAQHANASRVRVTLTVEDRVVCMQIHDNGRGFSPDLATPPAQGKCLGLLGMRERVEMLGGSFEVSSGPGRETTLLVRIPLHGPRPRKSPPVGPPVGGTRSRNRTQP
jgi:signal transduction histidine kinase